ncbi:uncharacterized protein LOC121373945 [Gigantopelta aegis]|uniref:uncharacterized protein LOC121373945 n=1 Tax=Gigantopelta aegis TaxID=1735272 RepID=UPI001B88C6B1|nr:uncharacterized protein LOC121373945 [Gigantopelta aegis]
MRISLVLAVLLVMAVCGTDAWGRFRLRRIVRPIWRVVKPLAKETAKCYASKYVKGKALSVLGKRSADDLDTNMDGVLDEEEIESILNTREAEEFLRFADGNDEIDLEELHQLMDEA